VQEDLERRLWGKKQTKAQLLEEDRVAFRPLPESPFEACRIVSTIANSESLVRFDGNDYSVPVEYAHQPVVAKGYVAQVVIGCRRKVIAQHARCWDKERQIFDPRHYLPLVEHKPGSLDHALPMEELHLPECFRTLRSRLEAEREDGQREYVRVLRLWGKHSLEALTAAVEKGLRMRAHSRDAIAQFLLPQEPWEQTTFRLDGREHLRQVKVAVADIRAYAELLGWSQPWGAPAEVRHEPLQHVHAAVGASSQGIEAADDAAGVRLPIRGLHDGPQRLPDVPASSVRAGADRPGAAGGGAPDPGGALPGDQDAGQLRLHRPAVDQRGVGPATDERGVYRPRENVLLVGNSGTGKRIWRAPWPSRPAPKAGGCDSSPPPPW